ncbi:MAG TPA: YceI family protein [Pseudonocardiaceae bacterium]|jgi:polyisoprenoid-binding protein YceI|nr:YceI family protein [Pseudonocardiaceae bacterium]
MVLWRRRGRVRGRVLDEHALVPIPVNGGLLSGRIADATGKPLSNADISVVNSFGHAVVHGETDTFGSFVAALAPGAYQVTARAGGYLGISCAAEIDAGGHAALGTLSMEASETQTPPAVGTWRIDPAHSSIRFVARHLAMSRIHGTFNRFGGTIEIAPALEDCLADVVIDAASIDTGNNERDTHLRSADFLDITRYPTINFSSSRFVHLRGDQWSIEGALTMHGATDSVRLDANFLGTRTWNGTRAACTATTELHRAHYTMNWQQILSRGITVVGSTIDIILDVQAVHEP